MLITWKIRSEFKIDLFTSFYLLSRIYNSHNYVGNPKIIKHNIPYILLEPIRVSVIMFFYLNLK